MQHAHYITHHPKTQHEYAKKYIRCNIPKVITNSPNYILNKITTHSLQGFSGYIKQYILNNSYEVNFHIQTSIFVIDNYYFVNICNFKL